MPIRFVAGDPLLTKADFLAFGHNKAGRVELAPLQTRLLQHYPAPFRMFMRQCKQQRIQAGSFWLWTESTPKLMFLVVRESSVGATRLRYVQSVVLTLARDYRLHGLNSLAIARLGQNHEWPELRPLLETWFSKSALKVVVYEDYQPGVQADEGR